MVPVSERSMPRSVVIVDDSMFILNRLERFFREQLGFTVPGQGKDGNEAIALYEKHQPDLITLDISMPNKRGNDAAREILEKYPGAKIMIISAVRGNEILDSLSFGAKGYMEKPLRFEDPAYVKDFCETVYEIFPDLKSPAS
jgi:two-component system, chemotaxis family, chemotaxis protein CheY